MTRTAEIFTDFEHDVKIVRHMTRFIGGSRCQMEHLVFPKNMDQAKCAAAAMDIAMTAFVDVMERAGYKVRPAPSDDDSVLPGLPK